MKLFTPNVTHFDLVHGALIVLFAWGLGLAVVLLRRYLAEPIALDSHKQALVSLLRYRAVQQAKLLCTRTPNAFHRVALECLCVLSDRPEQLSSVVYEAAWRETHRLRRGLGGLLVLSQVSLLVGLLGTLQGLMTGFQVISRRSPGRELRLTHLGQVLENSLQSSALGLAEAIVLLAFWAYLSQRHTRIVESFDAETTWLADRLKAFFVRPEGDPTWREAAHPGTASQQEPPTTTEAAARLA